MYSAIGSCPGMPKVYARTTQASFHILVSLPCLDHSVQSQLSKWWASCGSLSCGELQSDRQSLYAASTMRQCDETRALSSVTAQIMELLGPSLWDLCKEKEPILSVEFVAYIAIEALQILEGLHVKGCGFGRPLAGSGPHGSST